MPLPSPKQRTAYGTYLYFAGTDTLKTFLRDYRRILEEKFQKIRTKCTRKYWTCRQEHDPRNWNWKAYRHLDRLCCKRGLDDFAIRDILFERQERELECECQVLYDERELREEALRRQFGVDFYSGDVDWRIETELQNRFKLKWEMEFGILTADDGMAEFSGWESF